MQAIFDDLSFVIKVERSAVRIELFIVVSLIWFGKFDFVNQPSLGNATRRGKRGHRVPRPSFARAAVKPKALSGNELRVPTNALLSVSYSPYHGLILESATQFSALEKKPTSIALTEN
jgi:hypothetical protein